MRKKVTTVIIVIVIIASIIVFRLNKGTEGESAIKDPIQRSSPLLNELEELSTDRLADLVLDDKNLIDIFSVSTSEQALNLLGDKSEAFNELTSRKDALEVMQSKRKLLEADNPEDKVKLLFIDLFCSHYKE